MDTGRRILCLDVPKAHPGQHILQLLGLLCPGEDYRLESSFASPLRNGDVVVARSRVNAVSFEVGSWTPSATVLAGTVWLRQHVTAYVTSLVDLLRPNCLMRSSRGLAPNVVRVWSCSISLLLALGLTSTASRCEGIVC